MQQSRRATAVEYGPLDRTLGSEIRGSRRREQEIGDWFGQLGSSIDQSAQQTDASYGQANAAMLANIEAAQKAAQANQAQIAGGNADFAALTGADPTAFAQGTQEAAAAASQRGLTQAMLAAPIAQAGASQAAHLRNLGLNAGREAIHQRGLEGKRRQKIKQELLAARRERGQKTVERFGEIRDKEADRALERWKVNKAFPLEQAEMAQNARDDEFDNNLDLAEEERLRREEARKQAEFGHEKKQDKKGGGLTPSERNAKRSKWNNARAAALTLYRTKEWGSKERDGWEALTKAVMREAEVAPAMARAAVNRLRKRVEQQAKREEREAEERRTADPNGPSVGR